MHVIRRYRSRSMPRPRSRRRGVGTIELLLALPILLMATLASFEFGILTLVEHAVATATIDGSREAGKGAGIDEVAFVIDQHLAAHHLAITPTGPVRLIYERRISGVTQVDERGNSSVPAGPNGPALFDGDVRITVCVRATDGQAPIPDWLASLGFSLADKTLRASSIARLE